jgi:hypothetical protein
LASSEYVPTAHGAQTRSATDVPAAVTDVPGAHVVHATQDVASDVVLNVPLAHAEHVRSVVGEPVVLKR